MLALTSLGCVGSADDGTTSSDAGIHVSDGSPVGDAGLAHDAAGDSAQDATVASHDASPLPDAPPGVDVLAQAPGCFFTAKATGPAYETSVGEAGVAYRWITIDYDVIHGGWREDLYHRPVLNHNLMGLSRNVQAFVGRYILGNAAQIKPPTTGLARVSLMYGRVDLQPRPQGQGYTGYTGWRQNFAWRTGDRYHVQVRIDAVTHTQRLAVTAPNGQTSTLTGDIAYYEPSLSEPTFTLQLGGEDSDEREVRAVGWQFCDLNVQAAQQ